MTTQSFSEALAEYARELCSKFTLRVPFDPEDQFKKPTTTLLEPAGRLQGKKAPGKGSDPYRFKGADKKQWEKFKDLPNLISTDGNDRYAR